MANEITASVMLKANTALGAKVVRKESKQIDMAGDSVNQGIQSIATGGTQLEDNEQALGGTPGMVFVKNLDTSNYVTIGTHATSNHLIKLLPGEFAFFPLYSSQAITAEAQTAACVVEYAQYVANV